MPADQTDDFATAVAEGRIHHEDGRLVVDPPEPAAGTHPPVQDVDELHARYTPPGQGGWTGLNADLADRVAATEAERDQARRDLDYARAAGNVYRRQYLQARAELATLRQALAQCEQLLGEARDDARRNAIELAAALAATDDLHERLGQIITDATARYEKLIVAIRGALSGPGGSADYWRWNGQVQVMRVLANEIARIAGIPAPDWEGIKASIPPDGIYRAAPVPGARAPEADDEATGLRARLVVAIETALAGQDVNMDGTHMLYAALAIADDVLAVLAETAAAPAVDPAPASTTPAEGDRADGDDHAPQKATQPAWRHTDEDLDAPSTLTIQAGPQIWPDICVSASWDDADDDVSVTLPPAAAASLHAWLGQHLGTAPSTPDRPAPGPQDIPDAWLGALLAEEMHPAGRVRAGYRLGYAAHAGCEIEILDGQVHIGDLAIPAAPASEGGAR